MSKFIYSCVEDGCTKTGANAEEFRKVEVKSVIGFAFIVCVGHAKKYE